MGKKCIGCNLGGTNLRAGVVDVETGEVSDLLSIPTLAREGHAAVIARMTELAEAVMAASGTRVADTAGIGVGVPGMLDLERGETLFLPNLPGTWPHVPLSTDLGRLTGLPVYLLNDVRSITFGEWRCGAGRRVDTLACFAIGTGIGGGLVINGRLHLGIGGTAGELGHQMIDYNGPPCGCGNRGCVEAYASRPAIVANGIKAIVQGLTTSIGAMVNYDLNRVTPEVIARPAREGDAIAREIYVQAGFYIGLAAANVCVSLGPRKIVIAGGVAQAGDVLLEPIRRTLRERVRMMAIEQVEVLPASLDANAGVIGAALWASDHV